MLILVIDGWDISCEFAIMWLSLDLSDGKSTLVQVIAISQQAITLANLDPDLFGYIASLGHSN